MAPSYLIYNPIGRHNIIVCTLAERYCIYASRLM